MWERQREVEVGAGKEKWGREWGGRLQLPHARFICARNINGKLLLAHAVHVFDLFFQTLQAASVTRHTHTHTHTSRYLRAQQPVLLRQELQVSAGSGDRRGGAGVRAQVSRGGA